MAHATVKFRIVCILLLSGASGHMYGDFPLTDCDTGQFDILVMSTVQYYKENIFRDSLAWAEKIPSAWTQYGNVNSRVLVSNFVDTWNSNSISNDCLMVLTKYDGKEINICEKMTVIVPSNFYKRSIQLDIQTKIKIAVNIYNNTGVGRQNTTRVAIIVVYAENFPYLTAEEIRGIPAVLREEMSDMKVIVVVHNFNTQAVPTFLPGTLIVNDYHLYDGHIAAMSLCNKCLPGWFLFENKETSLSLSCYKIDVSPLKTDHHEAMKRCNNQGSNLAAVESIEELKCIQSTLFFNLLSTLAQSRDLHNDSTEVYIGLKRDSANTARRFQWIMKIPKQNRPLVVNHWLPGHPVGGFSNACGLWSYKGIINYTATLDKNLVNTYTDWSVYSNYMSANSEGWSSVSCGLKISRLSLCEITLQRYLQDQDLMKIGQANKDSFDKLSSRIDFIEFEGNIVSVPANVNNIAFLTFLKARNENFPMFECGINVGLPRYISYAFVCDYKDHCSNRRDETVCSSSILDYNTFFTSSTEEPCESFTNCDDLRIEDNCDFCLGRRCCDGTLLPAHLFNDGEIDCTDCQTNGDNKYINDESFPEDSTQTNETCAFICNRNQCVYPSQLDDNYIDCTGPEGPLDETLGKLERANSCSDQFGRLLWAPMCVYLKDKFGSVLGCRDLSHLQNCSDFPCQEGYYKCPGSYCIPLHYVHDGKSDCPAGEEEEDIMSSACVGNFACWNSKVCLHPDLVCDRHPHCPYKDDELNCEVSCENGLRCVAGTVTVRNKSLTQINSLNFIDISTSFLDLSGVDLSNVTHAPHTLLIVLNLMMSRCNITDLYILDNIITCDNTLVDTLDLSYNLIPSLRDKKFRLSCVKMLRVLNVSFNEFLNDLANPELRSLETLDLSHTGLSYLSERSFAGLTQLKYLNLSFTKLSTFQRDIFPPRYTLGILDLRGAPIVKFYENTFNGIKITLSVYANNFGLCCPQIRGKNIPEYMCHASEIPISSCYDLLEVEVQRILLWLMALIALLGNMIVILFRFIWDRAVLKNAYGLFVLNLGISDLIMGLYLLVIATADVYYRGVYVVYDKDWRESAVCKVAGFLATLSSETSTFFIFLITVDRYLVLKFPFGQNQFSTLTKTAAICLAWGIGILLALIPIIPIFGFDTVFSSNAMCNGLPLTNDRVNGWKYTFGVFIVLNFVMFLIIALGQMAIFQSISTNRISLDLKNQNSLRRAQDITVAKQLSLVVLSNFFCWFPVGLMGFLSLSGHEISNDVYAWTVVLVLPVNSAINPVLYTIPVLMARWKNFKLGKFHSR